MNFLRNLSTRSAKKSIAGDDLAITKAREAQDQAVDPPPSYSASSHLPPPTTTTRATPEVDSPFAFLGLFDTIFLIDDSGSMAGKNWQETSEALSAISPIITEQDADGVDIYFLNHRNKSSRNPLGGYSKVTSPSSVQEIFRNVRPSGGTPTGTRLHAILKAYLKDLSEVQGKKNQDEKVKPLNIIVITDGAATDDVESPIVRAARQLDTMEAEPWQVGIQFFQVGKDRAAAVDLQELDDGLADQHNIRDMVDTVPWNSNGSSALTAEGIMKVTMGAINRRLDRKRSPDERLKQR